MTNGINLVAKGLFATLLIFGLSACESTRPKQGGGAVLGAAGGGLLGSMVGSGSGRLAATAAGAVLGGLLGSETGKSLDRADAVYARQYAPVSQVPVAPPAGYAYTAPPAYSSAIPPIAAPPPAPAPQAEAVQPFGGSASGPRNCKPLVGDPGTRMSYACQGIDGNWFIAR